MVGWTFVEAPIGQRAEVACNSLLLWALSWCSIIVSVGATIDWYTVEFLSDRLVVESGGIRGAMSQKLTCDAWKIKQRRTGVVVEESLFVCLFGRCPAEGGVDNRMLVVCHMIGERGRSWRWKIGSRRAQLRVHGTYMDHHLSLFFEIWHCCIRTTAAVE